LRVSGVAMRRPDGVLADQRLNSRA
jgi:hypothetical protein